MRVIVIQWSLAQWLQLDLGFKVTYIAQDGLDMIADAVAKYRRMPVERLWRDGRCLVRFSDFAECDLARRLRSTDRPLKFSSRVNRVKRSLLGFTDVSIDDFFFEDSHGDGGGGLISVTAWTERTYNIKLRYGHLPGIETVSREEVANGRKQVVIPIELAILQGAEPVQTKGDPELTKKEIKITTGGSMAPTEAQTRGSNSRRRTTQPRS